MTGVGGDADAPAFRIEDLAESDGVGPFLVEDKDINRTGFLLGRGRHLWSIDWAGCLGAAVETEGGERGTCTEGPGQRDLYPGDIAQTMA